jgi:hypothetical protein
MNKFGFQKIYTWKYHNETSCIVILNKNVFFFSKTEYRKEKQVLAGVGTSGRGRI